MHLWDVLFLSFSVFLNGRMFILIIFPLLYTPIPRCPNLTHLLLDFSHGAQLADFSELNAFPTKIKYLCMCLSETIFLDNFMKKIYNFINGVEMLHLYGTYEQGEEEEGEVYEVRKIMICSSLLSPSAS